MSSRVGVRETVGAFATFVDAVAVCHLNRRSDIVGVEFIQTIDVSRMEFQVVEHARAFVGGQGQGWPDRQRRPRLFR